MTYWWSGSQDKHLAIEEMSAGHVHNALKKLERGDYFDETGDPPSPQERLALEAALGRRIDQIEREAAANQE